MLLKGFLTMRNNLGKIILIIFMLSGCASVSLQEQYDLINWNDGISEQEAIIIGQQELTEADLTKRFHIKKGSILGNHLVEPYPDFWFVSFYPVEFDDHFARFLVVIKKETGDVVRTEQYRPLRVLDYKWVFNGSRP